MDRSVALKAAGIAVFPVIVAYLASTENELVLVNLLVVLTGILFAWRGTQLKVNEEQLLREGLVKTSDQAHIAAQLIDQRYARSDAIEAALQCSSLKSAIAYLQTKCDMCSTKVPISQMVSMVMCQHNFCKMCGKEHFKRKICIGKKYDCVCPCGRPEITNEDQAFDYFSTMDTVFKNLLDAGVYDDLQKLLMNGDKNPGESNQIVSNFKPCNLCEQNFREEELLCLLRCQHEFCSECIGNFFNEKVSSGCLKDCVCPICKRPNLIRDGDAIVYFQELHSFLEPFISANVLKNFQKMVFHYEEVRKEMILCSSENIECTFDQMELALQLMEQGFNRNRSVLAAKECSNLEFALQYLQRQCQICFDSFPESEMMSMLACSHSCCVPCAKSYFTVKVSEEPITSMVCPFCEEPNMDGDTFEYLSHMETLLKHILDPLVHSLFERKIRDVALEKTPDFRWCINCQFGFLVDGDELQVDCPECDITMCRQCKRRWAEQHEGISCEIYAEWLRDNDPDHQAQALSNYLKENGINCPACNHHFALARGGCPHYTCTECQHEFCFYCREPYRRVRGMLHVDHHRNCGSNLVGTNPEQLQEFLRDNGINFKTEVPPDQPQSTRCPVPLTNSSWSEHICNRDVHQSHAGLCRDHYVEYLIKVIWDNQLEIEILL